MKQFKHTTLFFLSLFCYACTDVGPSETWTSEEIATIQSLSLNNLQSKPHAYSNKYADNPKAIEFGRQLFFDSQLSANGDMSCASCHQPDKFFTDGLSRSVGESGEGRNAPTIVGSAWLRWFYWDGRRDSLWSQALIPFEAPDEMGSSRLAVVKFVISQKMYRQQYEILFGPVPNILLRKNLPDQAGPLGSDTHKNNWYRLPKTLRKTINQVFANIGKSVASYERTLAYDMTKFDLFASQLDKGGKNPEVLDEEEVNGLKLFIDQEKTQCLQCHNGPLLTNNGFHNVGTGKFKGQRLDFGRLFGLQAVIADEFNCLGPYSDAEPERCSTLRFLNKTSHLPLAGAFKTPSLRNLHLTGPYFHDGRFFTLEEVVKFYNEPPTDNGEHELKPMDLSDQETQQLVTFLKTLSDPAE